MKIVNIKFDYLSTGSNACNIQDCLHIKTMPFLSIAFCISGKYVVSIGNSKQLEILPGECFIAPSKLEQHIVHKLDNSGIMIHRWIFIDAIINEVYHFDDMYDFPIKLTSEPTAKLISYADELNQIQSDDLASVCRRNMTGLKIIELLLNFATEKSVQDQEIVNVINYIRTNYPKKIKLEELVAISNFSQTAFLKKFKSATKQSPMTYLMDYRLTVAASKLFLSNDSVSRIAEDTGFFDQFYMSKCFKKKFGMPPFEYRTVVRTGMRAK